MTDLLDTLEPPAERPGDAPDPNGSSVAIMVAEALAAKEDAFDWFTDDSVILREQLQTAVYRNRVDAIVIRQEGTGYNDEDHFVILRDAEAVRLLIAALQQELRGRREG